MKSISVLRFKTLPDLSPTKFDVEATLGLLNTYNFINIDGSKSTYESLGWADALDWDIHPSKESCNFGKYLVFSLRYDARKISGKIVKRYAEMEILKQRRAGRQLKPVDIKQILEITESELIAKAPLNTKIVPVIWQPSKNEIWLLSGDDLSAALFAELWSKTFTTQYQVTLPPLFEFNCDPNIDLTNITSDSHILFLQWLWDKTENSDSILLSSGQTCRLEVKDKLVFQGDNKSKVTCSGNSHSWPEAETASKNFKSLSQISLKLTTEDASYSFSLDSKLLAFKNIKAQIFDAGDETPYKESANMWHTISTLTDFFDNITGITNLFLKEYLA